MSTNGGAITEAIAKKVVEVVDAGLSEGVGKPIPGQMCVEAAVCFAMGLASASTRRLRLMLCFGLILSGCSVKHQQITYAGLQGADLASTHVAESRGAVEANPLMEANWPVRIALKSAVTVLVLYGTSKLAREHQTVAKTVLMVLNSVLAGVVLNNLSVARTR